MATPRFWKTTSDPFTNKGNEFIIVWGTSQSLNNNATTGSSAVIQLSDESGTVRAVFDKSNFDVVAPTGVNLTTVAWASSQFKKLLVIPPGWKIDSHANAYGLVGSLEDLRGYI